MHCDEAVGGVKQKKYIHMVLTCACINKRRYNQGAIKQICLEEGCVENILHLFWNYQFGSSLIVIIMYTDIIPSQIEAIVPREKASSSSYDVPDLFEGKDIRRRRGCFIRRRRRKGVICGYGPLRRA